MVKIQFLLVRRDGMSREQFLDYHRDHHRPLFAVNPDVAIYVRHMTVSYPAPSTSFYSTPAYDAVIEIWFDTTTDMDTFFSPSRHWSQRVHPDDNNFADLERSAVLVTEPAGPPDSTHDRAATADTGKPAPAPSLKNATPDHVSTRTTAATTTSAASSTVAALDTAGWTLAAVIAAIRDAAGTSWPQALAADPARTDVLMAAGLLDRDAATPGPASELAAIPPTALADAAAARLSSFRQAFDLAKGDEPRGWADQPESVLLDQGAASAALGRGLLDRVIPSLPGLSDRLRDQDAAVLDVGTGVGALAVVLARGLPRARVVGIDTAPRSLDLARRSIAAQDDLRDRVELRQQDVADLNDVATYDLIWLPAPFLSEAALRTAIPRVIGALKDNGFLIIGSNGEPVDPLFAAVQTWQAVTNGGNALASHDLVAAATAMDLTDVVELPTIPGGPILVIGRKLTA